MEYKKDSIESFGFLTLATPRDYWKALGLVLSLRLTNPGIPVALAAQNESVISKIGYYFDHVIKQKIDICGFEHKLYLDHYSPYQRTLFLDSDILVFRSLQPVYEKWRGSTYGVRGHYRDSGVLCSGQNVEYVLKRISKNRLIDIQGAGHAYFEKPGCTIVFDKAREILKNYRSYSNSTNVFDEDIIAMAMTILDIPPKENEPTLMGVVAGIKRIKNTNLQLDVVNSVCTYTDNGVQVSLYTTHFLCETSIFFYRRELRRLFRHFGIKCYSFWWLEGISIFIRREIWWKVKTIVKTVINHVIQIINMRTHSKK